MKQSPHVHVNQLMSYLIYPTYRTLKPAASIKYNVIKQLWKLQNS